MLGVLLIPGGVAVAFLEAVLVTAL